MHKTPVLFLAVALGLVVGPAAAQGQPYYSHDNHTEYDLLEPSSHSFAIVYFLTERRPGATVVLNQTRSGSAGSDIAVFDPVTGERAEVVDELQEAVVQCLDCMHDQPHLAFHNGRIEPIEDRWERMVAGTPWVASCTVTVDSDSVESCSGPEAADALAYAAFGDHGTREFFTHVRFHKHDEDRIVVHLLVELYARSPNEATEVLEEAARGQLEITSLAEESRPPAHAADEAH